MAGENQFQKKQLIGMVSAVIIYLIFHFVLPVPEGLERPALCAFGILLACIALWVTEALPLFVTVIIVMVMLPVGGILPVGQFSSTFMTPVIFFVFVAYGISAAFAATPIPYRMINFFLNWSGSNSKKVIYAFVFCCAVMSAIISNIAATALLMGLALSLMKANGNPEPGTTNLGRALLIGIPGAAQIGGMATPVGNSLNVLAMTMIEQGTGIRVTFLDWCILGIPFAIIAAIFLGWWLSFLFKPEPITEEAIAEVKKQVSGFGKLQPQEKKVIIWLLVTFAFWLSSTWFPALNIFIVGMVSLAVAFLPGVNLLNGKKLMDSISWDVIMMIGGIQALAMGIVSTGGATWLVNLTFAGADAWPMFVVLLILAAITAFLHIIIPTGPPVVALTVPPFLAIAAMTGVDPATLCLIVGTFAGIELVFPLDSIPLITYGEGYYSMSDMAKYGIVPTAVLCLMCATIFPFLAGLIGF
jgi:sodium-dependent dicarboxylate transporter 2/3/5